MQIQRYICIPKSNYKKKKTRLFFVFYVNGMAGPPYRV